MLHGSADIFYLPFQSKSGTTRLHFSLSKNRLLKQYNEVYCNTAESIFRTDKELIFS